MDTNAHISLFSRRFIAPGLHNCRHQVAVVPNFCIVVPDTVHLQSCYALMKGVGSDVHRCLYRPEPV
jgi:hypothetical protein